MLKVRKRACTLQGVVLECSHGKKIFSQQRNAVLTSTLSMLESIP